MRSQLQHAIKDEVGNPHGHCTEKGTLHRVIRYPMTGGDSKARSGSTKTMVQELVAIRMMSA